MTFRLLYVKNVKHIEIQNLVSFLQVYYRTTHIFQN